MSEWKEESIRRKKIQREIIPVRDKHGPNKTVQKHEWYCVSLRWRDNKFSLWSKHKTEEEARKVANQPYRRCYYVRADLWESHYKNVRLPS